MLLLFLLLLLLLGRDSSIVQRGWWFVLILMWIEFIFNGSPLILNFSLAQEQENQRKWRIRSVQGWRKLKGAGRGRIVGRGHRLVVNKRQISVGQPIKLVNSVPDQLYGAHNVSYTEWFRENLWFSGDVFSGPIPHPTGHPTEAHVDRSQIWTPTKITEGIECEGAASLFFGRRRLLRSLILPTSIAATS